MIIHICFKQINTASSKCGPLFHLHLCMPTISAASENSDTHHTKVLGQGGLSQWWNLLSDFNIQTIPIPKIHLSMRQPFLAEQICLHRECPAVLQEITDQIYLVFGV